MNGPDFTKAAVLGATVAKKQPVVERFSHEALRRRAEALLSATERLDALSPADLAARFKECRAINKALPVSPRQNPLKDPRVIYRTEDNFTANAHLVLSDETPKQELTTRLSQRETEIRASMQALASRLKTDHDRKVFVVALRWYVGELRGGKYYFQALDDFVADDGTCIAPNFPGAPKSYCECLGHRDLENLIYKERDRVLAEALGISKSSAVKKKAALHKTA